MKIYEVLEESFIFFYGFSFSMVSMGFWNNLSVEMGSSPLFSDTKEDCKQLYVWCSVS